MSKNTVGLFKYMKLKMKRMAKSKPDKQKMKDRYRVYPDISPNVHNNVSINSNGTKQHININGKETFIVNGKTLKAGTPEYNEAVKHFNTAMTNGMKQFDKGMEKFGQSMDKLGKTMKDIF